MSDDEPTTLQFKSTISNNLPCTIKFYNSNNEVVGVFDFGATPATFEGVVDASARMFVDAVIRIWGDRV